MNDSKHGEELKKTVAKRKYAEAFLVFITGKPQGIGFVDMMEELKIASPSTLTRNLKILLDEDRIVKIGKKYYPSGADFAVPTFRKIMDVIEKAVRTADTDKGKEPDPAAMIALAELTGKPGNPPPYVYSALPEDRDILALERLLEYIISGKIAGMESFKPLLSQFLLACFRFRAQNGMGINKSLLAKARRIEEMLFESEEIGGSLSSKLANLFDSAWYFIYAFLCETKDKQISAILDRILEFTEEKIKSAYRGNTEKKDNPNTLGEELDSIKHKIQNVLWCDQLMEVLFNRQFELFQRQLRSVSIPLLADFYGDLRWYAITQHHRQSGSGAAKPQPHARVEGSG